MRSAVACSLALIACSSPVRPPPAPAPPPPAATIAPRLVVLVVIDQLPAWGLAARRGAYRRGLARLLDGGVHFARAEYPYAITFTAPGHAAIGTGAPPHDTGIVANTWYRRAAGVEQNGELDPASPVLDVTGAPLAKVEGASSAALRVDGLAERDVGRRVERERDGGELALVRDGERRRRGLVRREGPERDLHAAAGSHVDSVERSRDLDLANVALNEPCGLPHA